MIKRTAHWTVVGVGILVSMVGVGALIRAWHTRGQVGVRLECLNNSMVFKHRVGVVVVTGLVDLGISSIQSYLDSRKFVLARGPFLRPVGIAGAFLLAAALFTWIWPIVGQYQCGGE